MDPTLISGTLELMILEVLANSPSYGYEITQSVKIRSGERFLLKEGSLYPGLHRLERKKMLESFWQQVEGRKRKYYRITALGQKELAQKRKTWSEFSAGIQGILGANCGLA
ncbi:helix-turn-helix transcriptional regulator [Rubinisphaera italica]|uniref:Lineage-specific thermal regulator protein n=1 Tax=Rubinisphaera italica TaxID=2527969 RepID=A0A5C5XJF4_9PLAN|nr:helix-turn-helix transcriptional regulator [Rubinisphaera italica]TWT62501.1 lineage-specific thermal regulator protein [Rubinisphaera italica]